SAAVGVEPTSAGSGESAVGSAVPAGSSEPASAVEELAPSDLAPALVARLAVEEMVGAGANELRRAYDDGELFARFGPVIVGAWSRYRARLDAADPKVFRAALRARLGIDLPGRRERSGE